tara:strand:- start:169 stop:351 length:183 start_codon:yes stop_codon:yes gene_type:complete
MNKFIPDEFIMLAFRGAAFRGAAFRGAAFRGAAFRGAPCTKQSARVTIHRQIEIRLNKPF